MDLDSVDPVSLDVAHRVNKVSFRFYSEEEAVRLSVRRLTSPHAFDELGRPIARGLYDPALGPTSYEEGNCVTCGLTYNNCPGHFGHIEMPVAVPNPLLFRVILKILRSSCWNCPCLRLPQSDLNLLLARLYFEDADLPTSSFAVESFRILRRRTTLRNSDALEPSANEIGGDLKNALVKNWSEFYRNMPPPVADFVAGVDIHDTDLIERNMLRAARHAWKRAKAEGRLARLRSEGWKETERILMATTSTKCSRCFNHAPKIRKGERHRLFKSTKTGDVLLSPTEIEAQIKALWAEHQEIFEVLYGLKGRETSAAEDSPGHMRLFVRVVLVPPSRFRPTSVVGNMTYAAEHPQNLFFQRLLKEIAIIMTANEYGLQGENASDDSDDNASEVERPSKARFALAMSNMQEALRDLYDSGGMTASSGTVQMTGIRQQLEAKAGLFRQHMMGKRVNFSCRSVIGPDVFLDTDEIGIPESFARLLTVPEPVTPTNLERMRRAVLNGPDKYPGAVAVEDWNSNGEHRIVKFRNSKNKKLLRAQAGLLIQNRVQNGTEKAASNGIADMHADAITDDAATQTIGNVPKRVHRHLKTGDIVLFNRQPTLHRVSIMAHKVRVLPGDRTIRFHYANCGSYNADFDGDEMNVHVPQDYVARAEAEELMLSSNHYVVPTSGAPIRGLIQDHIAAATLLSRRDTFLDRDDFAQLLYAATEKMMLRPSMCDRRYVLPEPAVIKPRPLWTGKQLISAVLTIVRNGRAGLYLEASSTTKSNVIGDEESRIIVRDGELLQGVVDKSSLGASMYGLVHAVQEVYGCAASDDFLSSMGRLCLHFLRFHGHTTGVDDLVLRSSGDRQRMEILSNSLEKTGVEVTNAVYAQMNKGDKARQHHAKNIHEARKLVEDMIRKDGIEAEDRLDAAMKSALNKLSSSVIKACVPAALKKSFPANGFALMTSTGAKGAAVNAAQISCLLGSTVLEGKRVPRMGGSGATLPCFKPFDASPLAGGFISSRFLTGISPYEFFFHAMSGREGLLDTSLKTANSGYLQRCLVKHLEGVRLNYDGSVRDSDESVLQFLYGDDGIDPSKSRWLNDKVEWQLSNRMCLQTGRTVTENGEVAIAQQSQEAWRRAEATPGNTLLEMLSPGALAKAGAISEKYSNAIERATRGASETTSLRGFLEGRYQAAAMEPGEAVGVLAAQGVGEPSTQMTLNTFHHAGSSSAHVTLGIPRLRELLMTASKYPKTPSMTLLIAGDRQEEGAAKLRRRLQNVSLVDLLLHLEVHEKGIYFLPGVSEWAVRRVRLKMRLPPEGLYRDHLGFGFDFVLRFLKRFFLLEIHNRFKREVTRLGADGVKGKNPATEVYLRVAQKPQTFDESDKETALDENLNERKDDFEDAAPSEAKEEVEMEAEERKEEYASSSDEEMEDDDNIDEETRIVDREKAMSSTQGFEELADEGNLKTGKKRNDGDEAEDEKNSTQARRDEEVGAGGATVVGDGEGSGPPLKYGSLGYVESSLRGVGRTAIEFEWAFPAALLGKLNIAVVMREAAEHVRLCHVERIARCFVESNRGQYAVITEGSNLQDIFEKGEGLVDFNRLETNDMYGILETYGVEAMRAALIQEFVKVFGAYGIPVNIRHLSLIADYMTARGSYRGFNRQCMDETPSPFQRMTFETSMNFLTDAALNGTDDFVKNPSAALSLGQVYQGGTGSFKLLHNEKLSAPVR